MKKSLKYLEIYISESGLILSITICSLIWFLIWPQQVENIRSVKTYCNAWVPEKLNRELSPHEQLALSAGFYFLMWFTRSLIILNVYSVKTCSVRQSVITHFWQGNIILEISTLWSRSSPQQVIRLPLTSACTAFMGMAEKFATRRWIWQPPAAMSTSYQMPRIWWRLYATICCLQGPEETHVASGYVSLSISDLQLGNEFLKYNWR